MSEPARVSFTVVEFVDRETAHLKELTSARMDAADKELITARLQMERRLEGMNEFRAQLNSQAALFVTRDQLTALLDPVNEALDELKNKGSNLDGRFWAIGAAFLVIQVVIGIIVFLRT